MQKKMVFLSPVFPSPSGGGLAMRAYSTLCFFSKQYDIDLIVFSLYHPFQPEQRIQIKLANVRVECVPITAKDILYKVYRKLRKFIFGVDYTGELFPQSCFAKLNIIKKANENNYDVIHIFRIYLAAAVLPLLNNNLFIQVDIDDLESDYRKQLVDYYLELDRKKSAKFASLAFIKYKKIEDYIFKKSNSLFVASYLDKNRLQKQYPFTDLNILPNRVKLPHNNVFCNYNCNQKKLLFIGSLNYLPNIDGIIFFISKILPLILIKIPDIKILFAGKGCQKWLKKKLQKHPNVKFIGEFQTPDSLYSQASAVIVPLRLGAGTRIKILEAFSYKCPVITTSIGCYGLEVENNSELLIADSETDFSEACISLLSNKQLSKKIVENAYNVFEKKYMFTE